MTLPLESATMGVLETIAPLVANSQYVQIVPEAISQFCRRQMETEVIVPLWNRQYHFSDATERTVSYLLVLDGLNFCFWGEPRWGVEYQGEWLSGYWALAASLKRAIEEGVPITQAEYLERVSAERVRALFSGKGEIPLLSSRHKILREVGSVLREKYDGEAYRLVERAEKSAVRLVHLLTRDFPSFRDETSFQGQAVCFHKRAQILAADLHGCFRGKGWGEFIDLDCLTAFADYKLPQVLRHFGILKYHPHLARKVDSRKLLPAGSREEMEIRANTLRAVELIKGDFQRKEILLHSFEIDWLLWDWGQKAEFRKASQPHHRTLTVNY